MEKEIVFIKDIEQQIIIFKNLKKKLSKEINYLNSSRNTITKSELDNLIVMSQKIENVLNHSD